MNPEIIERVNRGETPFAEPDLSVAVSGAVAMGLLRAQREMPPADAYVIAVPTPFTGDHKADLSYITPAAGAVAEVLRGGEVMVLESMALLGLPRWTGRSGVAGRSTSLTSLCAMTGLVTPQEFFENPTIVPPPREPRGGCGSYGAQMA